MTDTPLITPVLLCGGSGTRLWPLSRQSYPKQFARLTGEESLFQLTARRLSGPDYAAPVIVTCDAFRFIVTEQLAAIGQQAHAVLIEPEGRNTAPAVLAAALSLVGQNPEALMLVAPSDHVIPDAEALAATIARAVPRALVGDLVTFGVMPDRAETGYGYIELAGPARDAPQAIKAFVEKPDATAAAAMLAAGSFLWNAGIFLFRADVIVAAYRDLAPNLMRGVKAACDAAHHDIGFTRLASGPWAEVQDISLDYAIMEKAQNLSVIPLVAGWSDLGGWDAVWRESGPDAAGNVCSSQTTAIDCRDSLLRSETEGLEVVGIGLENMVVVAMSDAVLVAPKSESQRVKEAVSALKARKVLQAVQLPRDYRPWGWYERLAAGTRFQVKRIVVNPGAALSLQSHHHRSEHWIVVQGTAEITVDKEVKLVTENESVYIPLGAVHRMRNPGKLPMVLIEVQTGGYLDEDDIIRYEDVYARE